MKLSFSRNVVNPIRTNIANFTEKICSKVVRLLLENLPSRYRIRELKALVVKFVTLLCQEELNGEMTVEEQHQCSVCDKEATQRCSGCQSVYYCSRDHQRKDWKNHRSACRSYRIERSPNIGRRLMACRDLKAGEAVVSLVPGVCSTVSSAEIDLPGRSAAKTSHHALLLAPE